ncbi:DUF5719 family protein [Microbacterium murale]|uniref:Large extracellular alpha-helical protein n=1 Tax=Microbacterium murale TaxID=1081040 RepID=A0ABU0PEE7_9MICO|nr:DUF5719 family protein [Microbacterium murale]MDQ0645071.1 hypothetical protein [Microbacterium murale]
MTPNRAIRVVATSARLLVGAVIAVGCVVGVTAAVALPWPGIVNEPAQVSVTPTAGDTTLVCTGDFRAIGRNTQNAGQMSSAGESALTAERSGASAESELTASDLFTADFSGPATGPLQLVGSAAPIAAAESISLAAEDLSGLAASACREPSTESWLIGGTVETGTSDLVILSNPGDVTATATITVFGTEQSSTTTLVPAGTQLAVPLSSVAAGLQQPVVRVTAAGAPLRAVLQSSLIRTLDPSGIDLQDTAGAPRTDLTFAGVQVLTTSPDSAVTVLRLMATDQAGQATITIRSNGEEVQTMSVPLEAAIPVEVNLDGLPTGVYSVEVAAEAPVVGAVRQITGIGIGADFAWMTPAPELSGEVAVAVPDGPNPRIHLVNSAESEAAVTLTPTAGGTAEELVVPAGGSLAVKVSEDATYSLSTDTPLHAAIVLAGTNAMAGWPIWPAAAAQDAVTVYP